MPDPTVQQGLLMSSEEISIMDLSLEILIDAYSLANPNQCE